MLSVTEAPNPYESPRALTDFIPSTEPRMVSLGVIAVAGATLGAIAFLIAKALVPSEVASPGEHDLLLANYLGFLFPPTVGLWAGWIRRSARWSLFGVFSGLLIGALYYALCNYNFLAVMVAFPCLLGGVASVLLGTKAGSWMAGMPQRFGKGLVAGLVLGFVYMLVLNVLGGFFMTGLRPSTADYVAMMWRAGPVAMGVAGAMYLMLFRWSSGLSPR